MIFWEATLAFIAGIWMADFFHMWEDEYAGFLVSHVDWPWLDELYLNNELHHFCPKLLLTYHPIDNFNVLLEPLFMCAVGLLALTQGHAWPIFVWGGWIATILYHRASHASALHTFPADFARWDRATCQVARWFSWILWPVVQPLDRHALHHVDESRREFQLLLRVSPANCFLQSQGATHKEPLEFYKAQYTAEQLRIARLVDDGNGIFLTPAWAEEMLETHRRFLAASGRDPKSLRQARLATNMDPTTSQGTLPGLD